MRVESMFNFNTAEVDRLCAAILTLKTKDECRAFLEDVCTIAEVQALSQRLTAAMLLLGGANYHEISAQLGLSTATISRVSRSLNYGAGGYKTVLERLNGVADGGASTAEGGADNE